MGESFKATPVIVALKMDQDTDVSTILSATTLSVLWKSWTQIRSQFLAFETCFLSDLFDIMTPDKIQEIHVVKIIIFLVMKI